MRGGSRLWPLALLVLTAIWAAATYFGRAAHGVTGSDPCAYAQMAVDLVQHGTLLHRFPLAPLAVEVGIASWPTVHVGYHLPAPGESLAASVWPPGMSWLLAAGYGLAGERGLLAATPLLGLLALAAAGALTYDLFPERETSERLWLAAVAVFILATSRRQIELAVVPMSDVPAQMFSTLATWATVRAARRRALGWGVAAGAALGAAYLVRHTQLLMIAPMIAAARLFGPPRERWRWLLPAALAAAVLAVPDLWYHRIAFGSPFIPESEELANFALANVVPIARGLVVEFSRTNEYFYLLPFLAGGAWALWRSERPALALWVMWVATLILFHLPYSVLRLRGILSAMPAFAGVTAFGIVAWVRRWWPTNGRIGLAPALLIILPALALGARSRLTLRLPFGGQFSTFGYLNSDQRSAVEKMAQVVPPDGVIGSSLNSGAVDLYAGREAFRPAYWTETEFDKFLGAMDSAGRPVYLLGDGEEMDAPLDWARKRLCPTAIWNANLPFFSPDGQASDANVTLWQLTPSCAPASPSSFVSHSSLFPQEANLP